MDAESTNRLHQAHTLSPETRRALLASSLSTRPDKRGIGWLPSIVCGCVIAAFLVWVVV